MNNRKGFTIVEVLVIVVAISILATIGGLAWRSVRNSSIDSKTKTDLKIIANAIDRYHQDNGQYPAPTGCYTSGCSGGQLAGVLIPKYMKELPKDYKDNNYHYIANGTADSYAIQAYKADGSVCKSGKNMQSSWFSSAPECNF